MDKKYKLEFELTKQQVAMLRFFAGECSKLIAVYETTEEHLSEDEKDRLDELSRVWVMDFMVGGHFEHSDFQDRVENLLDGNQRATVTVGDKEYYEDELAAALESIKPIGE